MPRKDFNEFTFEEMMTVCGASIGKVINLCNEFGISAGSTPNYDLYVAVQKAIRKEWERANNKDIK